jgi:DsbC/DsbD-like thiol-disulfide interchange protein
MNRNAAVKRCASVCMAVAALLPISCNNKNSSTVERENVVPDNASGARLVSGDTRRTAPSDSSLPVRASIRTDVPTVRAGGEFIVAVDVWIAPGWHIYALDGPSGVATPTSIGIDLPKSLVRAGEWTPPAPSLDASSDGEPSFVYEGVVAFCCHLRVSQDATPGRTAVRCVLAYQACDRFSCRPPEKTKLETEIKIVP